MTSPLRVAAPLAPEPARVPLLRISETEPGQSYPCAECGRQVLGEDMARFKVPLCGRCALDCRPNRDEPVAEAKRLIARIGPHPRPGLLPRGNGMTPRSFVGSDEFHYLAREFKTKDVVARKWNLQEEQPEMRTA